MTMWHIVKDDDELEDDDDDANFDDDGVLSNLQILIASGARAVLRGLPPQRASGGQRPRTICM